MLHTNVRPARVRPGCHWACVLPSFVLTIFWAAIKQLADAWSAAMLMSGNLATSWLATPRLASCSLLLAVAVAVKHILHVHSGISAVLHFQHAEANSVPCAVLSP